MTFRILILGGTTEARQLGEALAGRADIVAMLSLAGRTRDPAVQPLPTRVGGFGGPAGLAEHLRRDSIDLLVDATHPFAERISANAVAASAETGVPLIALARAPWTAEPRDRWTEVPDLAAAAAAIGAAPRRVLLTVGRLGLSAFAAAPQHQYLVRTIDRPDDLGFLPHHRLLLDRGPFPEAAERALIAAERIDVVVTKNSGGAMTYGKIAAARALGLPVILVRPPERAGVPTVHSVAEALALIDHHASGAERGV